MPFTHTPTQPFTDIHRTAPRAFGCCAVRRDYDFIQCCSSSTFFPQCAYSQYYTLRLLHLRAKCEASERREYEPHASSLTQHIEQNYTCSHYRRGVHGMCTANMQRCAAPCAGAHATHLPGQHCGTRQCHTAPQMCQRAGASVCERCDSVRIVCRCS